MHHHHHHHHGHGHHDHHSHLLASGTEQKNIAIAFFLNFSFAIIELIGGFLTGSVAILSSALHDLGDSLSLGLAYVLVKKSNEESSLEYSYGYRRYSLLSALITGLVLVAGSIFVLIEAIPKLLNPELPDVSGMMGFAVFGLAVNGFLAYRMSHGGTINEKVISWHLMEDVLGWAMVLIVGIIMYFYQIPILDPLICIAYTFFILFGVIKTLGRTIRLFLQASPDTVDVNEVESTISAIKEINGLHDIHIWSLDGQSHVLTLHANVADELTIAEGENIKETIRKKLEKIGVFHTTIELEATSKDCPDEDCVKGMEINSQNR